MSNIATWRLESHLDAHSVTLFSSLLLLFFFSLVPFWKPSWLFVKDLSLNSLKDNVDILYICWCKNQAYKQENMNQRAAQRREFNLLRLNSGYQTKTGFTKSWWPKVELNSTTTINIGCCVVDSCFHPLSRE